MKKVGDLMKELGFKQGASEEVMKAFIKNLIRQAYGVEVKETEPSPQFHFGLNQNTNLKTSQLKFEAKIRTAKSLAQPEQLSFELDPVSSEAKKLA